MISQTVKCCKDDTSSAPGGTTSQGKRWNSKCACCGHIVITTPLERVVVGVVFGCRGDLDQPPDCMFCALEGRWIFALLFDG